MRPAKPASLLSQTPKQSASPSSTSQSPSSSSQSPHCHSVPEHSAMLQSSVQPSTSTPGAPGSQCSPHGHAPSSGIVTHPPISSSHVSAVQATPSPGHTSGAIEGWQPVPATQVSGPLQTEPSSHSASMGVWTQPAAG